MWKLSQEWIATPKMKFDNCIVSTVLDLPLILWFFWVSSGWLELSVYWNEVFKRIAEMFKVLRGSQPRIIFRPTFFASFCESAQTAGGK